jgi:hypothetical protein
LVINDKGQPLGCPSCSNLGDILLYCFNAFRHACKSALDKNNAAPLRTDRLTDELPMTSLLEIFLALFAIRE